MEALRESGQEQEEAITLINTAVTQGGRGDEILRRVEEGAEDLEGTERTKAKGYVHAIREETRGTVVTTLDPGVGGMWNGQDVHIATGILYVDRSIDLTIAQVEETKRHEDYHAENDHTAPLIVMAETKGDIAAVIGGTEFTETTLIEGLTVAKTGDQFVSVEYVQHKERLLSAVVAAGIDLSDVENAVNDKKDLRLIDDRREISDPAETTPALA